MYFKVKYYKNRDISISTFKIENTRTELLTQPNVNKLI